jgi:hypothetical protein
MNQKIGEIINRRIGREAIARSHLGQALTTRGQKHNRNATLASEILQIAKILWSLKQPGARLARQWQYKNNRLLLLTDCCKQALLLICWLNVQQAKIPILVEFHRDLFFLRV